MQNPPPPNTHYVDDVSGPIPTSSGQPPYPNDATMDGPSPSDADAAANPTPARKKHRKRKWVANWAYKRVANRALKLVFGSIYARYKLAKKGWKVALWARNRRRRHLAKKAEKAEAAAKQATTQDERIKAEAIAAEARAQEAAVKAKEAAPAQTTPTSA